MRGRAAARMRGERCPAVPGRRSVRPRAGHEGRLVRAGKRTTARDADGNRVDDVRVGPGAAASAGAAPSPDPVRLPRDRAVREVAGTFVQLAGGHNGGIHVLDRLGASGRARLVDGRVRSPAAGDPPSEGGRRSDPRGHKPGGRRNRARVGAGAADRQRAQPTRPGHPPGAVSARSPGRGLGVPAAPGHRQREWRDPGRLPRSGRYDARAGRGGGPVAAEQPELQGAGAHPRADACSGGSRGPGCAAAEPETDRRSDHRVEADDPPGRARIPVREPRRIHAGGRPVGGRGTVTPLAGPQRRSTIRP